MRKYLIIIEKTKTGYSAYVPDLPGCIATGKSKSILEKNIYKAIELHLELLKLDKVPIPRSNTNAEFALFRV